MATEGDNAVHIPKTPMPLEMKLIAELPEYEDVEHLDATIEIEKFRDMVSDLTANPGFQAAHSTCRGSRRIGYALEEEKWNLGPMDLGFNQRLTAAKELMDAALRCSNVAISAARTSKEAADMEIFFSNIAKRNKELLSWTE